MTIITLKNLETGNKVRIKSIIDPMVDVKSDGDSEIIQKVRWIYEDSGEDVPDEIQELLDRPRLYQTVSKDVQIYKIE